MKKSLLLLLLLLPCLIFAQSGFVRTSGKQILDPQGNNLIIRSIGTGNWMLQEGYMMQTSGVAGTQWQFKNNLLATIGTEKTDQFYKKWLDNHFRRIDVDSMAHWGYNSVRPALHYKLFTLPIEDEPIAGVNTWLDDGFIRLDSLIEWCAANSMYVILDMHGAPGGQGKDANISDYDPSKPSLWESELNKSKFVALWRKIAERYANHPWVAGYDLINETNWTFPEGNNSALRALYERTTAAIREVDPNHMIVIEGNWFANDFSGLTPAWDDNMIYSFHKYWTYNDIGSIQWVLNLRDQTNCPIWLGETGENSNTWFTDCIELMENNNIGWSFWPVKKTGINNILKVNTNEDYTQLVNYWKGNAVKPTVDQAFQAVMTFAENHKFENCIVMRDVIDAMIRQPQTTTTLPFKSHTLASTIFAVDYDLGRAGYAYADSLDANYHLSTNNHVTWNSGYQYRSDGVDIDRCNDATTNGYCVGWIENGDWLQYTLSSTEDMTYNMLLRYAGAGRTAKVYVEINGRRASKTISLPSTGGWDTWKTAAITNIIIPKGTIKVRLVFESGGVNVNYFQFRNPKSVESTAFEMLSSETAPWADEVTVRLNKPVSSLTGQPFLITLDGIPTTTLTSSVSTTDSTVINITVAEPILNTGKLKISYTSSACSSGNQLLSLFQSVDVVNKTVPHQSVPGRIEAEAFAVNKGFSFETCTDNGGGQNTSYAATDKYLDFYIWVQQNGTYQLDFRIAVEAASAQIAVLIDQNGSKVPLKSVTFSQTGGWQNWQTQSTNVPLKAGKNIIRLLSRSGGYNLNWIEFSSLTTVHTPISGKCKLYPNPAKDYFFVQFEEPQIRTLELVDLQGRIISKYFTQNHLEKFDILSLLPGMYIVKISDYHNVFSMKFNKI